MPATDARFRRRALLAVVLGLAATLLAAACGDDTVDTAEGDPTTDSVPTSDSTTDGTVEPDDPDDPGDAPIPADITATGQVTDADGVPIASASLDLGALEGQPNPEVDLLRTTDDDGRYFLAIAPGRWLLTILADGFELEEVELDVPAEGVLETDVVLTRT